MTWTLPNLLSVARLMAAPLVLLIFTILPRPAADLAAFCIFTAASLTDFLDGWLARRWAQESAFGAMLDPIADKAMVVSALCALAAAHGPAIWLLAPTAAILLREVFVSGLREYLGAVKLQVTRLAKWKTTAQMVAIGALLLGPAMGVGAVTHVGIGLLWLAAALTLVSGWDYLNKGLAVIMRKDAS